MSKSRKIYVLDEDGNLQEIDAGISKYDELDDAPILTTTLNTTVTVVDEQLVLSPSANHKWSEEELITFCDYATDGRYDIFTEDKGPELLLIHNTQTITGRQYRRISSQYDYIYSPNAKMWININDTSRSSVIFNWVTPPTTITYGAKTEIEYTYYNQSNKIGVIQLYVNDNLKATVSRNSSTTPYTIDITNYLSIGDNSIELRLGDLGTGATIDPLYAQIKVINLVLTSTFTEDQLYEGSTLNYTYNFTGAVNKTIFFQWDELEPTQKTYNETSNAINASETLDITNLEHGIHKLRVWGQAQIDTELIKTDELSYNLPIWKEGDTIIAIKTSLSEVEEGSTVAINYIPYDKKETVDITMVYPTEWGMDIVRINVPTSVQRTWSFVAKKVNSDTEQEEYILQIKANTTTVNIPLTVIQGEQINYETSSMLYELDLIGRDNVMTNRNIVNYKTIQAKESEEMETQALVNDFNFSNDGWLVDEEEGNRNILRLNANCYIEYPNMNLLASLSNVNYSGVSFEVDFKGRNTTNSNKTLISLGKYILVKEQSVEVSVAGSSYKVEYKAGERIRIAVTIGANKDDNRKVCIYINGVLSFVSTYASTTFNNYLSTLTLNSSTGFLDIYGLRLYRSELTMSQVLNNYIASYNSTAEKVAERDWNDIYADDLHTIVSYDKVKKLMPTFVFKTNKTNTTDNLPPSKGQKRYGNVNYIDPTYQKDFTEDYVAEKKKPVLDVQGTSSQKYPRKNFKAKTNNKYAINDAIVGEKVFTFKKDYMDSSHANNTGLAKLVQTLYFTPVPPQISYIICKTEGEEIEAYDIEGRKIDYTYIYEYAEKIGEPFSSLGAVSIIPALLVENDGEETIYKFAYTQTGDSKQITMCEIDAKNHTLKDVYVKDKSYVRTTIYGQPCAFFWENTEGTLQYQGIYNFNTDKVSENNMELENEGTMSFEFANNVTDAVLFKSCQNFTDVRSSFEYRAYEKDGISIGLWEDYYDADLTKWANGGQDGDDVIPILNALYDEKDTQLFTKVNDELAPINYPFLTINSPKVFKGEKPNTLEAQYRLNDNGDIEAAHVNSSAVSDNIPLNDTIEQLGGDQYYEQHDELTPIPSVTIANPIDCQIINSDANFVVQWGYEEDGEVKDWHSTVYVSDLLTTIPEEYQSIVQQTDVSCSRKSGTVDTFLWNYVYPVETIWESVATADNIFDKDGQLVTPTSLRKYDIFEIMYQPVMDVVQWVISCWEDYQKKGTTSKFVDELEDHINKEYLITYYVMALFAGAADSLAKNMFWNSYDGGTIWYPVWYDIDTCFGLSNDGHPNFPYSLEIYGDGSKLGNADIYNGAKSNFWQLVAAAFETEIQDTYNKLRNERLTYDKIMSILYDQQIALIAPAHYNEDARFSYLDYPTYYYTAQGNRYERLKYWVENRFNYLDSELENDSYKDDSFELRNNAALPIEITPDITMFLGIKFGQHQEDIIKKRCEADETVIFDPLDYGMTNVNDLETIIYGASHIKSLGDLSYHQVTSMASKGESVLESILIGSENSGYINNNFTNLVVGTNKVLHTLNVSNCVNLGKESSVLDLSKCPSIQSIYALNTKLSNIKLPEGSPLRILHLPAATQDITLVNQIKLTDLVVEGYENISSIVWENTSNTGDVNAESVLNNIYNLSNNSLQSIRLIDYMPQESVTISFMNWLMSKNSSDSTLPYITGRIAIKTTDINTTEFKNYMTQFINAHGNQFVCASKYDEESEETKYYAYNTDNDTYELVDDNDPSNYKLILHLDQIVEDEYIFGVTGEGE